MVLTIAVASPARAQCGCGPCQCGSSSTTLEGDSGLWFLPGAMPGRPGEWAVVVGRTSTARSEQLTRIDAVSAAGHWFLTSRTELFGGVSSASLEHLAASSGVPPEAVPINEFPYAPPLRDVSGVDGFDVGLKRIVAVQHRGAPALAVRVSAHVPVAASHSTSQPGSIRADLIAERKVGDGHVTAALGYIARIQSTSDANADAVVFAAGAAWPMPDRFVAAAGLRADLLTQHHIAAVWEPVGPDFQISNPIDLFVGVDRLFPHGVFVGGGMTVSVAATGAHGSGRYLPLIRAGMARR